MGAELSGQPNRLLKDFALDMSDFLNALALAGDRQVLCVGISYGCVHALACAVHACAARVYLR